MTQLANIPLSIGNIYVTTGRLWRTNAFKKIQWLALLTVVWLVWPFFFVPTFQFTNPMVWLVGVFAYYGVPFIFHLLVLLVFFAAVYYCTAKVLANQEIKAPAALKEGFKKLIFLIPAVVISSVAVILGYLAFVIPGIILQLMLMLYYPLIIVDEIGPITAFKRSFQLIDGHWWRTLLIIGLPLLVLYGVMVGIEHITHVLIVKYTIDRQVWIIQYLIRMLLGALFLPFFVILMLVQINDLKLRQQLHGQT